MTIISGIDVKFKKIKYKENHIKKAINFNDKIEDNLHVIIVLSNPCEYARRYQLTTEFIRRMREEKDIILYIVELAYGNQEFYVTEKDNCRHLQLRCNSFPLWHKENLINIGIKKLLPTNWKAVAWIDSDIEFDSASWASDTLKILNGCKDIVQIFSQVILMDANENINETYFGFGYQYTHRANRGTKDKSNLYWHPGFGWACTRKLYERIEGLFEHAIIGGGDLLIASCAISDDKYINKKIISENYNKNIKEFKSKIEGCRLGYVPGLIRHYYHGSVENRQYDTRQLNLSAYDFSPELHLTKDENEILIPTELFPEELLYNIYKYFSTRYEDDCLRKEKINNIDLLDEINKKFNMTKSFTTLINLENNIKRLESSKEELKKVFINEPHILKATNAKNISQLQTDLNNVFNFMKTYNNSIPLNTINIDEFGDVNDENIKIRGGVLACYCGHIRAMIDGYNNQSEYTIITEDDIEIIDIHKIETYIKSIPNNWDILCLGSEPKEKIKKCFYSTYSYYRFDSNFCHLQFYIIKNNSLPIIFQNLYPITDQIDNIIGSMHNKLNIYNIPKTTTQKTFITNV